MRKGERLSEFESYLEDRKRMTRASLSAIEKAGIEAALDRCRALAQQIQCNLRHRKAEHLVDVWALADFQAALERAASVLEQIKPKSASSTRNRGRDASSHQLPHAKAREGL